MKQNVYAVFDLKSKTLQSSLITAPNDYIVKRNLIAFSNSIAKSVRDFPGDFAVFLLGELDDEKPCIKALDQAEMMFSMTEVIDYVRNHQEETA